MSKDKTDHGRGVIKDNALAALVTSKVYKSKVEPPKKGKGSQYNRKVKHKGLSKNDRPFYYIAILNFFMSYKYY